MILMKQQCKVKEKRGLMIKMKYYLKKCYGCSCRGIEQPHTICKQNLKRGVKLKCLNCGYVSSRYQNFKGLVEYHFKNNRKEDKDNGKKIR